MSELRGGSAAQQKELKDHAHKGQMGKCQLAAMREPHLGLSEKRSRDGQALLLPP